MKALIITLTCIAAVAMTLSLTGCDKAAAAGSSGPSAGKQCVIQFRRDALGAAASLPIAPMTGSINGAETTISGVLKSSSGEWVVLDQAGKEIWVLKSVILLIQF
jgi:hypothetical protein